MNGFHDLIICTQAIASAVILHGRFSIAANIPEISLTDPKAKRIQNSRLLTRLRPRVAASSKIKCLIWSLRQFHPLGALDSIRGTPATSHVVYARARIANARTVYIGLARLNVLRRRVKK